MTFDPQGPNRVCVDGSVFGREPVTWVGGSLQPPAWCKDADFAVVFVLLLQSKI